MLHTIATASPCPVKMCKGTEVTFRCIPKAATDFVGFCCFFLFSVFCVDCDGKTVGLYSATLSYLKMNMAELHPSILFTFSSLYSTISCLILKVDMGGSDFSVVNLQKEIVSVRGGTIATSTLLAIY